MSGANTTASQGSLLRTLQHGLHVLDAIATGADSQLSAHELAERLGFPRRTCYHLLETLLEEGYVVRFSGGRYGLGPKLEQLLRELSARVAPDPRVLPSFTRLHERVDWRVFINGWYGSDIIVQLVHSDHYEESRVGVGYRDYSTSRCSTKAILAFLSEKQQLRHFASRAHPAATERTITDFKPFRRHLLEVVEHGYALDLTETDPSWCGVAAPFFADSGFPLGSFGVAAPPEEFGREREALIEAVKEAGYEASRALGYSGPYPPSPLSRRTCKRGLPVLFTGCGGDVGRDVDEVLLG